MDLAPRMDLGLLDVGDELGRGGQGKVFDVRNVLVEGVWRAALKLYAQDTLARLDAAALEKLVAFGRGLPAKDRHWLYDNFAWPVSVVMKGSLVCGFLMRRVPADYYFDFRTQTQGLRRMPSNVEFLLNPDEYVENAGIQVTDHDRLRILEAVAVSLARLHDFDVKIGDLSPKNVLFRLQPYPSCFFIDCDSVRLGSETALEQVETTDWQAPEGEPRATRETDSYKFGLLAIRLFARDQTTVDPTKIEAISPALGGLAIRSQNADPALRPAPRQWVSDLKAAAGSVRAPSQPIGQNQPVSRYPPIPVSVPAWLTRRALLVTVGCLVVLTLLILFVIVPALSGAGPAATPKDPVALKEAATINSLLDRSVSSQAELAFAMNHVEACSALAADDGQIAAVVGQRGSELSQATGLSAAALANGVSLKGYLVEVLRMSLHADQDYLAWVNGVMARGCSARSLQDSAYASGYAMTVYVVAAKLDFLSAWDQVARAYGFQSRDQSGV
jgi:hypothetical protein